MHPDSIAALFVADRVDHIACEIQPALDRGCVVISDRYVHSSLAYQGVECDLDWVAAMNAPMKRPDLTIFVDVDPLEAGRRRAGRADHPELYEYDDFQIKVAEGYARARNLRQSDQVEVVDGSRSVRKFLVDLRLGRPDYSLSHHCGRVIHLHSKYMLASS